MRPARLTRLGQGLARWYARGGFSRWLWPITGLLALVWFLIRVIPKPSRAQYPCQQVAGKLAGGFLCWLAGLIGARWAMNRARVHLARRAMLAALLMFGLGIGVIWLTIPSNKGMAAFSPTEQANSPIGQAKGIYPGRVVWVRQEQVARWDGRTGDWWQDPNTDQSIVDAMLSRAIRTLTGQRDDLNAWDALFRYYNHLAGLGDVGYQAPEAIAIKINMNQDSGGPWPRGAGMPCPQVIQSLLYQLIYIVGVPPEAITVYDASRNIGDPIFNRIRNSPDIRLQKVRFVTRPAGAIAGRLPAEPDFNHPVIFADKTIQYGARAYLPTCVTRAKYHINVALLRPHSLFGITLCGKNHFGCLYWSGYDWTPAPLHNYGLRSNPMGSYNCLVDLIGHPHLGGKTILYLIDGLYGAYNQSGNVIRYASFGDHWSSLILASQDPIAIDSVGLDILRNEPGCVDVVGQGLENYLHEAALADNPPSRVFYDPDGDRKRLGSLGVHEHWNNPVEKLYSRNLGTGDGIELVMPSPEDPNGRVRNLRTGVSYDSIGSAVGVAEPGDVIVLGPGLYHESVCLGKDVTIRSLDPNSLEVVKSTIIDGLPVGISFYGTTNQCRIEGLTILGCGMAIQCQRASPVIDRCRIVGSFGPGLSLTQSSNPTLTNCL
ncbi:MAG: DUF362 domain-containing protein, partial [Sedimentisphaerales bacterium]|nr:DUF362 domain-containing protein [Sedimentisphaerales bacterium]